MIIIPAIRFTILGEKFAYKDEVLKSFFIYSLCLTFAGWTPAIVRGPIKIDFPLPSSNSLFVSLSSIEDRGVVIFPAAIINLGILVFAYLYFYEKQKKMT
ncbi:hypothetical protein [Pseudoalteromonas luteoviolacea]|uniref:Uncharacterized protein n=1 Tax=Pseudoalteromonas luteoviolacea S4054 TaxID=1129367 RepID=A0A0F6AEF3_9GAMM|nr:hypothetical protein [Pseudoalteromonas luteoviolacea]AOT10331.1 hypothetical protein S4054249_20850 [Pseudoalteromonas luteoviolacea]AOT15600.1 hypothetical protein S40542_22740 [Pseudoalteromonas luteoviolacea]AOT21056.1 hypothetical protein S4054_25690 [Pseudoalteromonas luteoviolacea]KKE84592.1 hypothetical protein N479_08485 [Pseudoalteromonas luteoviolacea S4054]KZN71263.1 hypothetical protein N481_18935 [Pseudoalteromonas luteoviolacea S4047-1]